MTARAQPDVVFLAARAAFSIAARSSAVTRKRKTVSFRSTSGSLWRPIPMSVATVCWLSIPFCGPGPAVPTRHESLRRRQVKLPRSSCAVGGHHSPSRVPHSGNPVARWLEMEQPTRRRFNRHVSRPARPVGSCSRPSSVRGKLQSPH